MPTEQATDKTTNVKKETNPLSNPLQAEDTTTIEHAVARLLKEPSKDGKPKAEPEPTASKEEEEQDTEEVPESESSDIEAEDNPDEEDETYEDEEDSEEPEEGSEEESEADDEEELKYYTVKVDGEEMEVTLDELRSGYQRQKDYTKKTQALAEERKKSEDKATQLEKLHTQFMNQATLANEVLNRDLKAYENVDWASLKVNDPVEHATKRLEMAEVKEKQLELQRQVAQSIQMQEQARQEQLLKAIQEEQPHLQRTFPEWGNEEKRESHQKKLADYARSAGFTDEELATVYLARDLKILDKARKYDDLMANREKGAKKKRPAIRKVVKSAVPKPKRQARQKQVQARKEQLRKSGSLRDAALLMDEMRQSKVIRK